MKIILCFLLFFIVACSLTPIVEYRQVSVPVKCNLTIPSQPVYFNNSTAIVQNIEALINYKNALLITLKACEGVE